MGRRIVSDPERVHGFVTRFFPLCRSEGMQGIGLERDGNLVAGVVFEKYTGPGGNIFAHVAAEPGARWLTREYLHYCFHYPFNELGCARVSGWLDADNLAAIRFDLHLGFVVEAFIRQGGTNGRDAYLMRMTRETCRYV